MYFENVELSDVVHDGRPVKEIVTEGRRYIWIRDPMTYDDFSYDAGQLSAVAADIWVGVSSGGSYMNVSSSGVRAYRQGGSDGTYQARAVSTKFFRAYNLEVSVYLREGVTSDRNVGLTLGGIGSALDGEYDFYSLYVRENRLFVTRGPNAVVSDNTTLYSNTSMGDIPAGSHLKLRREWVDSDTDRLTAFLNNSQVTTFLTPNLKHMPFQDKDFDTEVNYVGIRSAYHRAWFTNYFSANIYRFEAKDF